MSKQYLTEAQYQSVLSYKARGARFTFEEMEGSKHMLIATMPGGNVRRLLAVQTDALYPFSDLLD